MREAFLEVEENKDLFTIEINNVRNGIEALKQLNIDKTQGYLPDLIIIDINIPLLNGLDLLRKIKQHKSYRVIPSIIITNGSRKGEIDEAYRRGVNAFIIKPFKYDDFVEMVQLIKEFWLKYAILPSKVKFGGLNGK